MAERFQRGRGAPKLSLGESMMSPREALLRQLLLTDPAAARALIVGFFHQSNRDMSRLAKELGIGRTSLYRLRNEDAELSVALADVKRPGPPSQAGTHGSKRKTPVRAKRSTP